MIFSEHNYKRGLNCQKCKKQFKTLSEFVLHTKEHPHKPFICEHCHISFKSKRELNQHRSSHEHKDLVEKASAGPGGLKKKEISNFKSKNRKVIKCPSCDFKCSNLNELGKFMQIALQGFQIDTSVPLSQSNGRSCKIDQSEA